MINQVVSESWAGEGKNHLQWGEAPRKGRVDHAWLGECWWLPASWRAELQFINSFSRSCQIWERWCRKCGSLTWHDAPRRHSALPERQVWACTLPSLPCSRAGTSCHLLTCQKVGPHGGIRSRHCEGSERVCVFLSRCLLLLLAACFIFMLSALRAPPLSVAFTGEPAAELLDPTGQPRPASGPRRRILKHKTCARRSWLDQGGFPNAY